MVILPLQNEDGAFLLPTPKNSHFWICRVYWTPKTQYYIKHVLLAVAQRRLLADQGNRAMNKIKNGKIFSAQRPHLSLKFASSVGARFHGPHRANLL